MRHISYPPHCSVTNEGLCASGHDYNTVIEPSGSVRVHEERNVQHVSFDLLMCHLSPLPSSLQHGHAAFVCLFSSSEER